MLVDVVAHHESALTLAEAAERLDVTPARISQLITAGRLEGPDYGHGRAPKNAPRVWIWSVEEYEHARAATRRASSAKALRGTRPLDQRVSTLESTVGQLSGERAHTSDEWRRQARAARDAALQLKVAADAAIEDLGKARQRIAELDAEVATLRRRLAQAETEATTNQVARRAYGDALTQLLMVSEIED
jgi:hypothetical protein